MKSSTWKMDIKDRNNPGKIWMVVMTAKRSSNLWIVLEKNPLKPRHKTLNTTSCKIVNKKYVCSLYLWVRPSLV